jgi:hypothetical protein
LSYFGEVTYGTASMYTYDRHCKNLSGVNYVNYGRFDGYDENGQATASFTGNEIALSLGYSIMFLTLIYILELMQN